MIYILLPVHNRRAITSKFIDCLLQQVDKNFHLVLVDDGSDDGTAEFVRSRMTQDALSVITGHGHWWWAGSLWHGINWLHDRMPADEDVVLFINDDVRFDQDFLRKGIDSLRSAKNSLLLARFLDSTGESVETGVQASFSALKFSVATSPEEINCLSTRGLFIRWLDVKKIGNFRPRLLPHYLSDYEYTIRAKRLGYKLMTSSEVALHQDLSPTGFHSQERNGVFMNAKRLFSKKSPHNPYYRTVFLLMCCPIRYLPLNILRVWASGFLRVVGISWPRQ